MITRPIYQKQIPMILRPEEQHTCENFGKRINQLGANFAVCSTDGHILVLCEGKHFRSSPRRLTHLASQVLVDTPTSCPKNAPVTIHRFSETNTILAGVLWLCASSPDQEGDSRAVAMIDMGDTSTQCSSGLWAQSGNLSFQNERIYLTQMLGTLMESFQEVVKAEKQVEMVGSELAYVYEELVLLHKLSTKMKVTESDANFLQMACDSLTELIPVEGIAILLEQQEKDRNPFSIAAGSGLIDFNAKQSAQLFHRLTEEISAGKEALMDSAVFTAFRYDWPKNIRSVIAVPLFGKGSHETHIIQPLTQADYMIGLMVAMNPVQKQDFDSTDIKLFNSVANGCAVFVENRRLFSDLKDLFLGSLRALTHSIDAKDGYTHGHSERVAYISRWIAEQAARTHLIKPEQIHEAYFAGLLHDIGKIGIDDWVLKKKGPLTDKERRCIQKHPFIGAGILRDIKQMQDIVPGVLCHHERMDGSGYPQGLKGYDIPIIARIVGLADCFDAMTSERSYRAALSVSRALEEIAAQCGKQFDQTLGELFINTDTDRLWEILQTEGWDAHESPGWEDFADLAVGTLIR